MPIKLCMPRPVQDLCWAYMFYNKKPLLVTVTHPKITYLQKLWCGVV